MPNKVNVKKDDTVVVIAGKHKGKKGKIVSVQPAKNTCIVEDINIVKRHTKANRQFPQGGIMEKEAPINVSNVMVYCKKCSRPVRINKKFLEDGSKVRACNRCGEVLD